MKNEWPIVPFGEFLKSNRRPYLLGPEEDANLVGMRWYGLGPFHRELKSAIKIRKKSHYIIRAGDVIYNKLFAWKGAFGIVPPELDGMFVSDKFPTYDLDERKVDRCYLNWYFQSPRLWEEAERLSTGSAAISKLTLNPPKFDDLTIPLPPMSEQRYVAAKIERFSKNIKEARDLRDSLRERADALFHSQIETHITILMRKYIAKPLIDLADQERGISYGIVQTGKHHEQGILTLRAGDLRQFQVSTVGVKKVAPEIETKYRRTSLRGDEVLLRIRGGLGEVAVCPPEMKGGNVSREIAVIPLFSGISPFYVMYLIAAPSSQDYLLGKVRGTSYVGINLKDVRQLCLPIPPIEKQRQIVAHLDELKNKMNRLKTLQDKTSKEIDALLPSILDKAFKGKL